MPDVRWRVKIDVPADSAKAAGAAVKDLDEKLKDTHGSSKKLTDEVQKLQAKLRELKAPQEIHRLKKEIEEAEKSHHKMGGAMKSVVRLLGLEAAGFHNVGIAAHEARESTHEFLEFIGAEIALEMLKEMGDKLFEIGEEALKTAAKTQRLNRVINIAAGGREAGENTREWVDKLAKTSEFTDDTIKTAYIGLKRVGIDQKKAGLFIKAAADVAAVSENKDEAFHGAVEAFERMQVTGRVNARMLQPLGVGVKDIKALGGKYAHMDLKQLNTVLQSGTFGENEVLHMIMSRAHETMLGSRSADNADLLSNKLEKLGNLPDQLYQKLADSKGTTELSKAIDGILEKFDPDSAAGAATVGALESAMLTLAHTVQEIDFQKVADTLKNDVIPAVKEMIALVEPTLHLLEKTLSAIHTTFEGIGIAGKAVTDPIGTVGDLVSGKGRRRSAYEQLGAAGKLPSQNDQPSTLRDLTGVTLFNKYLGGNYLRDTVMNPDWWKTKSVEVRGAAEGVGRAAGEGMAQGMSKATSDVSDAAMSMSQEAPAAARQSLEVRSPSRVFEEIGSQTAAGLALGIDGGAGDVAVATERMISIPAAPSAGGRAPISVQVHVGGISLAHGGKAEGEAAADAFDKRVRGIIVDVFEQVQQGGGS